ncbi:hypothetical protein D3C72_1584270 [compost metagenome]
MTPAMASEPYCADAPSRSTSMRLMALVGICARSAACAPRFPSNALRWKRRPLTSTSVWSGDRPRSVAGRTNTWPSAIGRRCTTNDGTSCASTSFRSVESTDWMSCLVNTSTGARVSNWVRLEARVPVTSIASSWVGAVWLPLLLVSAVPASAAIAPPALTRPRARRMERDSFERCTAELREGTTGPGGTWTRRAVSGRDVKQR